MPAPSRTENTLRALVSFAYEHGYHEHGYDVVAAAQAEARAAGRAEGLEEAANAVLVGDIFEVYATGNYPTDDIEADTRAHAAAFIRALATRLGATRSGR